MSQSVVCGYCEVRSDTVQYDTIYCKRIKLTDGSDKLDFGATKYTQYFALQQLRQGMGCLLCVVWGKRDQGAVSKRKMVLPGMAIPMLKIRRPNGRLIFNMEIAIRR